MLAHIQKWGNSQGIRLPKQLLKDSGLQVGATVELLEKDGTIVIQPAEGTRGRYSLADLVARIPKGERAGEEAWGKPEGREEW